MPCGSVLGSVQSPECLTNLIPLSTWLSGQQLGVFRMAASHLLGVASASSSLQHSWWTSPRPPLSATWSPLSADIVSGLWGTGDCLAGMHLILLVLQFCLSVSFSFCSVLGLRSREMAFGYSYRNAAGGGILEPTMTSSMIDDV